MSIIKKIIIVLIIFLIITFLALLSIIYYLNVDTEKLSRKIINIKNDLKKSTPSKKKIIIVTLETRDLDLLKLHNKSVMDYSQTHSYNYIYLKEYENQLKLPIYWKKIQLVLDLLESNPESDYVMWMDSDTMVCQPEIPLEYILDKESTKSIFIGFDYPVKDRYNAGVFIIKNNDIGKMFLRECIKTFTTRDKCIEKNIINGIEKIEYKLNGNWSGECYEQGIMNELLFSSYKDHCYSLDNEFLLNVGYPVTDTLFLHLHSGMSNNKDDINYYFTKISKGEKIDNSIFEQLKFLITKIIKIKK